jgi:cell division protein ZapE
MSSTLSTYEKLVEEGELRSDPAQAEAAAALGALENDLRAENGRRLPWQNPREAGGLYLYGGVGAGKTLLMDLFARLAPDLPTKRRHYHVFMEEMHGFIRDWRGMGDRERRRHPARARRAELDDPIPHAAKHVFQGAELLCLDEMQVTDIADAMLLGRLFEAYFERGGNLVVTSNRAPSELYKNGINRELFEPFIELIRTTLTVHEIVAAEDYRLAGLKRLGVYFSPLGAEADACMDKAFAAQLMGKEPKPYELAVGGRKVHLARAAGDTARVSFAEFCERPLGAPDYLALSRRYGAVFIDNIPELTPENADAASRFRTLIDALYDHRCKLVCSAAAEPNKLYTEGKLAFEFERTASRLYEMRSEGYLKEEHRTGEEE